MKKLTSLLILAAALMAPAAYSQTNLSPEGTWLAYVTPDPACGCPAFINIAVYRADGTVEGLSLDRNSQLTGRGVWTRNADGSFSFAMVGLVGDQQGSPTLAIHVRATVRLSDNLMEMTGSG